MAKYTLISQLTFQQTAFSVRVVAAGMQHNVVLTIFGEEKSFRGTYIPLDDIDGNIRTKSGTNVPVLLKDNVTEKLHLVIMDGERAILTPHVGENTRELFKWAVEYKTSNTLMISNIKQTSPMRAAYFALGNVPMPTNETILKENTTALLETLIATVIPNKYVSMLAKHRNRVGFIIDMSMVKSPKIYSYNSLSNLWWDLTEYAYGDKVYSSDKPSKLTHTTNSVDKNVTRTQYGDGSYIIPHLNDKKVWIAPCNSNLVDSLLLQETDNLSLTHTSVSLSTRQMTRGSTKEYPQYLIRNHGSFARINISKESRDAIAAWLGSASGLNIVGANFEMFYSSSDKTAVYLRKRIQLHATEQVDGEQKTDDCEVIRGDASNLSPSNIDVTVKKSMGDQVMEYQAKMDAEAARNASEANSGTSDEKLREEVREDLVDQNKQTNNPGTNRQSQDYTGFGQWSPLSQSAHQSAWIEMVGGLIDRHYSDEKVTVPFSDYHPMYRSAINDIDFSQTGSNAYHITFARSQLNGYVWSDVTSAFMGSPKLRELMQTITTTTLLGWHGYTVVITGGSRMVLCTPVDVSTFFTETLVVPKVIEMSSPEEQIKHLIKTQGLQWVLGTVAANAAPSIQ